MMANTDRVNIVVWSDFIEDSLWKYCLFAWLFEDRT